MIIVLSVINNITFKQNLFSMYLSSEEFASHCYTRSATARERILHFEISACFGVHLLFLFIYLVSASENV